MYSGKKYLITGGSGFLGCHLALELLKRGAKVRTLDIAPMNEPNLKDKAHHWMGSVCDAEMVRKAMEGANIVIHAAAALPLAKKKEIFSTNVDGTRTVLCAAKEKGIERVIFVSSTAVYGVPKKHPIMEDDEKIGVGPYGESKILAEQVAYYFRQQGLIIPIIRPKTFIGTGRLGVFQILFDWVLKGARIPMIGNGENRYQLLNVVDLVDVILLSAVAPASIANDDFNVGSHRFKTVREDLETLCRNAGTGARIMATPAKLVKIALKIFEKMKLSPLYQWVYETADKDSFVSIDKISRAFAWQPKYSNAESLVRTYEWYRDHAQEYDGLYGTTNKVAWKQGILACARKLLGG